MWYNILKELLKSIQNSQIYRVHTKKAYGTNRVPPFSLKSVNKII